MDDRLVGQGQFRMVRDFELFGKRFLHAQRIVLADGLDQLPFPLPDLQFQGLLPDRLQRPQQQGVVLQLPRHAGRTLRAISRPFRFCGSWA